jgi:BirA family transcriptional regulator, biotin operon repressor / biotin---[acetyl-CoA-carboxylase] ligase
MCANLDLMERRPPERPPLDVERLRGSLRASTAPAYDVEVVDAAPSTNALVAERARAGAAAGLVVVAEHQTAGRGRLDRTWTTPARSALTFSVLLRPEVEATAWPWLPLLAGVAVVDALRETGSSTAGLKWPNDVLLGTRKTAGLLVERVETGIGPAAVVGIGLNVSLTRGELPVEVATSVWDEGVEVDRTDLLVALLQSLGVEYDAWLATSGDAEACGLAASYAALCTTLGQGVRVDLPGGDVLMGTAVRIARGGGLVVATEGGEATVGAGDVVHVRPRG